MGMEKKVCDICDDNIKIAATNGFHTDDLIIKWIVMIADGFQFD